MLLGGLSIGIVSLGIVSSHDFLQLFNLKIKSLFLVEDLYLFLANYEANEESNFNCKDFPLTQH